MHQPGVRSDGVPGSVPANEADPPLEWAALAILVLTLIALAPFGLALARRRPGILLAVALLVLPLPVAIPLSHTILRFGALILTFLMLIKSVQIATGDVRPRSWIDALQFFTILAVADWDAPRSPSLAGAARRLGIGLGQLGLFGAVVLAGRALRPDGAFEIVLELALYLALSSAANAGVFHLDLRGVSGAVPLAAAGAHSIGFLGLPLEQLGQSHPLSICLRAGRRTPPPAEGNAGGLRPERRVARSAGVPGRVEAVRLDRRLFSSAGTAGHRELARRLLPIRETAPVGRMGDHDVDHSRDGSALHSRDRSDHRAVSVAELF